MSGYLSLWRHRATQQPDDSFKIDAEMCSDCAACQSVCPFEAIEEKEDDK